MISQTLKKHIYKWPYFNFKDSPEWEISEEDNFYVRNMPEKKEILSKDSRWPCFFPSPMCIVTTTDGSRHGLEKVVSPSIINRFPYIIALSFCNEDISPRHHKRKSFMQILESGHSITIQFLPPGKALDIVMNNIINIPDDNTNLRIKNTNLTTRKAETNDSLVFNSSYLVYEAKLVTQKKDFVGNIIFSKPWINAGSHKVFFLEINAIQLREDIANGDSQIFWKSLPIWHPTLNNKNDNMDIKENLTNKLKYIKGYNPNYSFPSKNTIAFEKEKTKNGMAIKYLPKEAKKQIIWDNKKSRWPCFFPSPVCFISSWANDNKPNVMPCGSTMVVSRHPLIIAPCISYIDINERYAARTSYGILHKQHKFGCSIPFLNDEIVNAIKYTGNIPLTKDLNKVFNAGLHVGKIKEFPLLLDLPINYYCEVIDEIFLGTHVMFLGKVNKIFVRSDLNKDNPLEWSPWSEIKSVNNENK